MAGFSYQNHPPLSNFLVDSSVFLPNYHPSIIRMPNSLEEAAGEINNSNSSYFPYSSSSSDHSTFHDLPIDPTLLHCVDNNQTYVIERRKADSSSMVIDLDSGGDQVTQKKSASTTTTTTMHQKKRNCKDGSSCSSSIHQPKDSSNEKGGKKLKKWSRSTSKDTDEKSKADNNDKKNKRKTNIEQPPTGYVHVRARRGEATDSHSLAERVRREKISKRLKLLQGLVPGCEKVASKALMLDEIINYVQSLQHQVEFLSMKLASMTPLFCDFGVSFPDITVKLEKLDNLESPLPSVQQCINTSPSATLADHITASASIATTRKNSLADASVPHLLQQGQMPNAFSESQDNGILSWSLDDQRQRFINQCSFTNLCSFQENN